MRKKLSTMSTLHVDANIHRADDDMFLWRTQINRDPDDVTDLRMHTRVSESLASPRKRENVGERRMRMFILINI